MAPRSKTASAPWNWSLAVDDVGEFDLWVVPADCTLPSGPWQGVRLHFQESLQRGPEWSVDLGSGEPGGGSSSGEGPGAANSLVALTHPAEFSIQGRTLHSQRPAEGSACLRWQLAEESPAWVSAPGEAAPPEGGWLFLPHAHELRFGPRHAAVPVEDWKEVVTLQATPQGLAIACPGGVRMALAHGEFDAPEPRREIRSDRAGRVQLWCQARPGPPVFLTLEARHDPSR